MKLYISLITIIILTVSAFGQANNKTDPPNEERIISFTESEQMFQLLEGKWIFADMTCAEPYTVTVSADRKSIRFQYFKPQTFKDGTLHDTFTYNVLEVGSYYIRAQIEGETRKTTDGNTVVWDFRFLSPDAFMWHRTDWRIAGRTNPVTRCGDGKRRVLSETDTHLNLRADGTAGIEDHQPVTHNGLLNGKAIVLVKPRYPKEARKAKAQGTVEVQVIIDETGNVVEATAVAGDPLLKKVSEEAALASKFAPTILKGEPVRVTGTIVYNFVP